MNVGAVRLRAPLDHLGEIVTSTSQVNDPPVVDGLQSFVIGLLDRWSDGRNTVFKFLNS